jgi:hypothetical protein
MKRNSNSRKKYNAKLYDSFDLTDMRYYGVFLRGNGESSFVEVDPKRYQKIFSIPEDIKRVMDKRNGPLFRPAKKKILDYNINFVKLELGKIKQEWNLTNKPMIGRVLSEIQGEEYMPFDDELARNGVLDTEEAVYSARMKTWLSKEFAEYKKKQLSYSLYAQFFHQLVSQIEALQLKLLTKNGYEGDKFSRNVLYAFKSYTHERVSGLNGFADYDKMYAVWNFIKHNSSSTFSEVKKNFPEILREDNYNQGDLACFHIDFTDSMIDSIIDNVTIFLKEYCQLVFNEEEFEAAWNSEEHFLSVVYAEIEEIQNPCGIPWWI